MYIRTCIYIYWCIVHVYACTEVHYMYMYKCAWLGLMMPDLDFIYMYMYIQYTLEHTRRNYMTVYTCTLYTLLVYTLHVHIHILYTYM